MAIHVHMYLQRIHLHVQYVCMYMNPYIHICKRTYICTYILQWHVYLRLLKKLMLRTRTYSDGVLSALTDFPSWTSDAHQLAIVKCLSNSLAIL